MDLSAIKQRYYKIARQLRAHAKHVQFSTTPQHDGSPHIEYVGDELHYVVTERGQEYERRRTKDPDELLFWLVSDMTRGIASEWEPEHRIENEDSQRQFFRRHIELLGQVEDEWASRMKAKYEMLLGEPYPFAAPGGSLRG